MIFAEQRDLKVYKRTYLSVKCELLDTALRCYMAAARKSSSQTMAKKSRSDVSSLLTHWGPEPNFGLSA